MLGRYFWRYNFARIHKMLSRAASDGAAVTDTLLSMADLVVFTDEREPEKRGPYKNGRRDGTVPYHVWTLSRR